MGSYGLRVTNYNNNSKSPFTCHEQGMHSLSEVDTIHTDYLPLYRVSTKKKIPMETC